MNFESFISFQLINGIKTGDILKDTIFTIIVLTLINYVVPYIKGYFQKYTNTQVFIEVSEYYLSDIRNGYNDIRKNTLFDAIQRHITQIKNITCNNINMYTEYMKKNSNKYILNVKPVSGNSITVIWKSQKIAISYNEESKDNIPNNNILQKKFFLSSKNRLIINDFIETIMTDYNDSIKDPDIYITVPYNGDGLRWIGMGKLDDAQTLETVVLKEKQILQLKRTINTFLKSRKRYSSTGTSYMLGIILYGPAGTGKTSIIRALANSLKRQIYCLNISLIQDDNQLSNMVSSIPHEEAITVIEDIDCLSSVVKKRTSTAESDPDKDKSASSIGSKTPVLEQLQLPEDLIRPKLTLSGILNTLDGIASFPNRILIMTTNHIDHLDPALIRSGRIDLRLELTNCDLYQVVNLFKLYYPDIPTEKLNSEFKRHQEAICKISPARVKGILQENLFAPYNVAIEALKNEFTNVK